MLTSNSDKNVLILTIARCASSFYQHQIATERKITNFGEDMVIPNKSVVKVRLDKFFMYPDFRCSIFGWGCANIWRMQAHVVYQVRLFQSRIFVFAVQKKKIESLLADCLANSGMAGLPGKDGLPGLQGPPGMISNTVLA